MSIVDRQGDADLPGQWDFDPEGLIEAAPLRFPSGPAVIDRTTKACPRESGGPDT